MLQMFAPGRTSRSQVASDAGSNRTTGRRWRSRILCFTSGWRFKAQHDTLTGLPNRLLFQDRVQQATRMSPRGIRQEGRCDLDRSGQIQTDQRYIWGIEWAIEVLCELARRLQGCLRQSDSVARVGGDEFTVLAQDLMEPEDAERVAATILSTFALPIPARTSNQTTISASLGISMFPDHGEDPITLLRNADLAMYSAKRAGGGTFRMFRSALNDSMQRRVMLERELKTALERNELTLEYQPLLDPQRAFGWRGSACCAGTIRWPGGYRQSSLYPSPKKPD